MEDPLFDGADDISALLRQHDWSGFPEGPPAQWPALVRATIAMVLKTSTPLAFLWGRQQLYFYNSACRILIGDKHPQALARPFFDAWGGQRDSVAPMFEAVWNGEHRTYRNVEFTLRRAAQVEQSWFSFSHGPVRNDAGEIIGILIPGYETTAEVINARRLSFQLELADHLRTLTDPDQMVGAASRTLGERLGVARVNFSEVDEQTGTFLVRRDWCAQELPAMVGKRRRLDDFGPELIASFRTGEPVVIADVEDDPRTAGHAGAFAALGVRSLLCVPLLRSGRLHVVLALHRPQPGHWTELEINLAQDMAERTWAAVEAAQAQAVLQGEQRQTQYILDTMNEGFALLDRDWTILQLNAAGSRITTRPRADVIGRNQWEAVPQSVGTPIENLYRRVRDSGVAETYEHEVAANGGRSRWLEIRCYPSLDGGLAVFFRDISQRKNTEKDLRESNRRKDEFLAMLAHELRNPLAPISAAARLMEIAPLDGQRLKATSAVIGRQVNHMTSLIDDLLDVSRVTRGQVTLAREPLALDAVVASALEQVHPALEAKRHRLSVELPTAPALVMGDMKRLVQILTNLLNNAVKFTPAGGAVGLRVALDDDWVRIHVQDDGMGISPDLQPYVFDLFSQAERSADRAQGGLGLGLALVKSLAALHGGTVACTSAGLGRGSCFTVSLPRLVNGGAAFEGTAPAHAATQDRRPLRILLVDDNVDGAEMLAMLLQADGHEVAVEHSGPTALERARAAPPDVALLDIGLPGMDGHELARRLRADEGNAGITLIAVTGYGGEHDREASFAAGFSHHLVKPLDPARLAALLTTIDPR
jgi:PAS domain S-box-containing protein